jgi:hypothetical protein
MWSIASLTRRRSRLAGDCPTTCLTCWPQKPAATHRKVAVAAHNVPVNAPIRGATLSRDASAVGAATLPFLDRVLPSDTILIKSRGGGASEQEELAPLNSVAPRAFAAGRDELLIMSGPPSRTYGVVAAPRQAALLRFGATLDPRTKGVHAARRLCGDLQGGRDVALLSHPRGGRDTVKAGGALLREKGPDLISRQGNI